MTTRADLVTGGTLPPPQGSRPEYPHRMLQLRASFLLVAVVGIFACKEDAPATAPSPSTAPTPTTPATAAAPATPSPSAVADGCKDDKDNQGVKACEAACAAGSMRACAIAGVIHLTDDEETVADANAAPLLRKACEGGDGQGCHWFASFYRNGLGGIAKDEAKMKETYARAGSLMEKECQAGSRVSCAMGGSLYNGGSEVPADPAKALVMLKKGCDLGSPGACEKLKTLEAVK